MIFTLLYFSMFLLNQITGNRRNYIVALFKYIVVIVFVFILGRGTLGVF